MRRGDRGRAPAGAVASGGGVATAGHVYWLREVWLCEPDEGSWPYTVETEWAR